MFSFPSHATELNKNSDGQSLSTTSVYEGVKAILQDLEKYNLKKEEMNDKLFVNSVLKPSSTQVELKTKDSNESESTTRRTTSTSRLTTRKTTTKKRTTTKWITRSTTPLPRYEIFHNYGNTFKDNRILANTYIVKNYYFEEFPPIGPGPLAKALFSSGYMWGFSDSNDYLNNHIKWDGNADRRWRATTRAPYFENKVPGEDKILPASAVLGKICLDLKKIKILCLFFKLGAATAFGLESLLPLRVPANQPLMYCGNTNLNQTAIRMDYDDVFTCNKNENKFEIWSANNYRNIVTSMNRKMQCDLKSHEVNGKFYCKNGTLYIKQPMKCLSKILIKRRNEESYVLECAEGELPSHLGSFIPTTTPSAYMLTSTTTQKPLSLGAKTHIFMLKLMGKFDVVEPDTNTARTSEIFPSSDQFAWHPVPLTKPPEHTTSYAVTIKDKSDSESAEES